jgi:alginate O-acetyltransferase complex protein AlgI
LLIVIIVVNYFVGILIFKYNTGVMAHLIICFTLAFNLGVLAWYKYAAFAVAILNVPLIKYNYPHLTVPEHSLPLGISFFIFQGIAYVLDVHREEAVPQRKLFHFALFMALFPKIVAGPIIRYNEVADDLDTRTYRVDQIASGVKRFIVGLGKKVLIANTLALTADQVFTISANELTTSVAWLGLISYTLQLYFDFSGYSDMAIGLGRMFGFNFQENFNYPYVSKSLTEFWRRWHISLSTWLRDYLFIPLSYVLMTNRVRKKMAQGNYKYNYRIAVSITVVFALCGLWHGAGWNFVFWGGLHGLILATESLWLGKAMKKLWNPLQHVYLLIVVMLAWVFFRMPSFENALDFIKSLLGLSRSAGLQYPLGMYVNNVTIITLIVAALTSVPIVPRFIKFIEQGKANILLPALEVIALMLVTIMSFISLSTTTFTPFIYQKF